MATPKGKRPAAPKGSGKKMPGGEADDTLAWRLKLGPSSGTAASRRRKTESSTYSAEPDRTRSGGDFKATTIKRKRKPASVASRGKATAKG
jgi:hypothetical protein